MLSISCRTKLHNKSVDLQLLIERAVYFGSSCTDRSRIVQIHIAGNCVEVSILLAKMKIRVYSRSLATDITEKLWLHEDSAVVKSMSGRLFLQNASVFVSPKLSFTVVFNVVFVAIDVIVRLMIDRLAVDISELRALMHRFIRNKIVR